MRDFEIFEFDLKWLICVFAQSQQRNLNLTDFFISFFIFQTARRWTNDVSKFLHFLTDLFRLIDGLTKNCKSKSVDLSQIDEFTEKVYFIWVNSWLDFVHA